MHKGCSWRTLPIVLAVFICAPVRGQASPADPLDRDVPCKAEKLHRVSYEVDFRAVITPP